MKIIKNKFGLWSFNLGTFAFPIFLCLVFPSVSVFAQTSQAFYSSSGQMNATDYSNGTARSVVLGPAFSAIADDSTALFSNPAGLANLAWGEAGLHGFLGLGDVTQETLVVGLPFSQGGIAFAANYLDYGAFEGRDSAGSLTSNYGANRIGFQAGWGTSVWKEMDFGLALHFSQQNLVGNNYAFLTPDVGVLLRPLKDFQIGLDYLTPGLSSAQQPFISTFKAGAAWEFSLDSSTRLTTALGNSLQSDALDYLQAATEISFHSNYYLRAGYRFFLEDNGFTGSSSLSLGLGLALDLFTLDYAYSPSGVLGDSHRFSLTYRFGKEEGSSAQSNSNRSLMDSKMKPTIPKGEQGTSIANSGGLPVKDLGSGSPVANLGNGSGSVSKTVAGTPVTILLQPPPLQGVPPKAETGGEDPKSLALRFDIPADYITQGEQMEAQGRHKEALGLLWEATQQDPQNVQAWWDMGSIYVKQNQKAYAVTCFEKALNLRPDNTGLRQWLDQYKSR